jgi:hypothetical protein
MGLSSVRLGIENFVMTKPWDVPPFPTKGDDTDDSTYAGVGRVLSRWEEVEVSLTHIYAAFLGRPHDPKAHRSYMGDGRIFSDRLNNLRSVAGKFFVKNPNQKDEANLDGILDTAQRFSERRNEVSHGIVRPIQWYKTLSSGDSIGLQFVLVPPHYNWRKFNKDNSRPSFAYTSVELLSLERDLFKYHVT